MTFNIHR